jgi:hypothetical protein
MRENTSNGDSRRRKERPVRVRIEAQGHPLQVKVSAGRIGEGGGDRGEISTFSFRSRKRMLEKLARIDVEHAGFVCFVTVTYPDRNGPPSPAECERDRQVFLKRISRGYPSASPIWRREWESRVSGAHVGVDFPHFHLLFFGLPFVHFDALKVASQKLVEIEHRRDHVL